MITKMLGGCEAAFLITLGAIGIFIDEELSAIFGIGLILIGVIVLALVFGK